MGFIPAGSTQAFIENRGLAARSTMEICLIRLRTNSGENDILFLIIISFNPKGGTRASL